jgi:hypothetical protein
MRHPFHAILLVLFLATTASWAQERYHPSDLQLLTRLSYERSPFDSDGIQRMCIAVSQNGDYRMLSVTERSNGWLESEGTMSKDQFEQLKGLLKARAFTSLPEDHGNIIRSGAENFMAELWRQEVAPVVQFRSTVPNVPPQSTSVPYRRIHWLNADGESPFPQPLRKVIEWMKNFRTSGARHVESPDRADACPSVGFSLLQPSIATR